MARSIILVLLTLIVVSFVQCAQYMVYPKDRKNDGMCSELHEKLMELLGKGGVILRVEFRDREKHITDFWLVEATPEIINHVERWKLQPQPLVSGRHAHTSQKADYHEVGDIIEDYKAFEPTGVTYGNVSSDDPGSRTTTNDSRTSDPHWLQNIFVQQDAPRDLCMISWPKDKRFPQKPYGYRYDRPSQSAYPIGIIDGGIDPGNSVSLGSILWTCDLMHLRNLMVSGTI